MRRLLLLCLLFVAWPAAAQVTTASLGGRITDSEGPIEGVTVVLINQATNAQYYATTGRRGWYQLNDIVPGGPFTVRIHYFSYQPLTVRNIYLYAGQNTVIDANLETGTSRVYSDEAATSMRLGEVLGEAMGGGEVAFSPLNYNLVGQRVYTDVPFDVRQETTLTSASRIELTQTGSNRFHGSTYGFFSTTSIEGISPASKGLIGGITVSTPLGNEDYQLFAGLQYNDGLAGAARLDARLNEQCRLDLSGGRLDPATAWASAGLSAGLGENISMRLQAGWYGTGTILASDDFTFSAGRHRLLAGVQFAHQSFQMNDSTASQGSFYVQDVVRLGRRLTVLAGVRFAVPFSFSPRASIYYDVLGTGALVLRAGTAVYGQPGGSSWKNLGAIDIALPAKMRLSLEATFGQVIQQLFYIKSGNILDSRHALTARIERPYTDRLWTVASYTWSDGPVNHRLIGGFSYKAVYAGRMATTLSLLYDGRNYIDDLSPASISWSNGFEARLSQDIAFSAASRDHTLQLTGYYTRNLSISQFLFGLRYFL